MIDPNACGSVFLVRVPLQRMVPFCIICGGCFVNCEYPCSSSVEYDSPHYQQCIEFNDVLVEPLFSLETHICFCCLFLQISEFDGLRDG